MEAGPGPVQMLIPAPLPGPPILERHSTPRAWPGLATGLSSLGPRHRHEIWDLLAALRACSASVCSVD